MIDWFIGLFDYMPEQASSWAADVDFINNFITIVSVFCIVGITLVMLYFAWKYRRKSENQQVAYITHNVTLETLWTVIPTLVVIFTFYYGFIVYYEMRTPPVGAMEINVQGYSWGWDFQYANGKRTSGDLVVPVGEPVKLVMTSRDVIHSFFIPAMRVKEDVYQGNYSYLWFNPTKMGEYHIFCTEYCGTGHSQMGRKLKVVSKEEFQDFLNDRNAVELSPLELGAKLYKEKACITCHSLDGSRLVGPSFQGLFDKKSHEMESGLKVDVDENYVRESILNPAAKIVKGYPNAMPAFEGQLSEDEIAGLIAFLKEQK
ncbi:MAG TPA: cytochrome c oxidase subunit II [Oligoflexia bacterium]|nr:cytochrome c oxidase subunit II [Oligoflexia bacterium]HMP47249.1 cytochrome c oxidase subunit II [Oligoflexia bacterium]